MKRLMLAASAALMLTTITHAGVIDLETPLLTPDTHKEDWGVAAGFSSGGAFFNNFYDPMYGSWAGFALSKEVDATTPGYGNQYSARAGSGAGGSAQFAVGYFDSFNNVTPTIQIPVGQEVRSIALTNTTYAALSLLTKTGFNKKFGGDSGNDPDYFRLTISGYDAGHGATGSTDFYLADYRFANNALDYIVTDWRTVDLAGFGSNTRSLEFTFDSTDLTGGSIATPLYVAVDNLTTVPEPASLLLLGGAVAGLALRRRRR
jgi:hypothetical protein